VIRARLRPVRGGGTGQIETGSTWRGATISGTNRHQMPQAHITIHVAHPEYEPGPIRGFKFFWAYYVNGFDQTVHCQHCFKGSLSAQFNTRTARSGKLYTMNERSKFPYLYICGVGVGPKNLLHGKNFHLPLELRPGARETGHTYNGYTITVEDAVAVPIAELPEGWHGPDCETTRCKNFRFAVAQFGWIDQPQAVE
jgi:hypothetical protein